MVDTDQDTMDTPTATAMVTIMDIILARGMLMLMPQSTMVDTMDTPVPMDMVCTTVDTMVDTTDTPMPPVTDMPVTLARGPLMPNLRLMLMPLSTMVMAAVTTVMEAVTTVMVDTHMAVSDTDGRFFLKSIPQLHSSRNHKMFFNIKTQKLLTIFMLKSI